MSCLSAWLQSGRSQALSSQKVLDGSRHRVKSTYAKYTIQSHILHGLVGFEVEGCKVGLTERLRPPALALHSTRRAEQMPKFYEWRSRSASLFLGALEHTVFVAKAKRADTADIVHGQQIVKRVEWLRLFFSFTAQFLSASDVITQDDTPCPPVGVGVDPQLLKEVFIWAYGRSAEKYAAVRQLQRCVTPTVGGSEKWDHFGRPRMAARTTRFWTFPCRGSSRKSSRWRAKLPA